MGKTKQVGAKDHFVTSRKGYFPNSLEMMDGDEEEVLVKVKLLRN